MNWLGGGYTYGFHVISHFRFRFLVYGRVDLKIDHIHLSQGGSVVVPSRTWLRDCPLQLRAKPAPKHTEHRQWEYVPDSVLVGFWVTFVLFCNILTVPTAICLFSFFWPMHSRFGQKSLRFVCVLLDTISGYIFSIFTLPVLFRTAVGFEIEDAMM